MLAHQVKQLVTFNDKDFLHVQEIDVLNPFDLLGLTRV
jgi:hypothetical protein